MEQYTFSNIHIDLACKEVEAFLSRIGVERREALRTRLTFEEVLLGYQARLGEDAAFRIRLIKRLSSSRIELIVPGASFDPLDEPGEADDVIRGLLADVGLAPTWSYKNNQNHIVFILKKKPLSATVKMGVAIALAVLCGLLLSLAPDSLSTGVSDYVLTPVTDAFMGLISAVSVPLVFLSILSSICSMGNMETLGRIGSKTLQILLVRMIAAGVLMTGLSSLFYPVELSISGLSGFAQLLTLFYDVIPTNLFEPFVTGNTLQLIFISVMAGLAMLILSSKVDGVFRTIEQLDAIFQTIMSGISALLPILIFVLFTDMIASGNLVTLLSLWKMLLIIILLLSFFLAITLLRIAVAKKVSPWLLVKKLWQTFIITFTTASSAAAFGTNVHDTHQKLGVHKTLAYFGIPLGQVLYDPAGLAIMIVIELTMAELFGIPITLSFLVIALITNLLLSLATPPVPGGSLMCYIFAFAQLGIPMEAIGIVLVADLILDFPATACNTSGWQLAMIDVANALDMLDEEALHKRN